MRHIGKHYSTKSGVALYLAVLIGTIVMATSMGISTIFYRELRISRVQFPSLLAFYAADTGTECAFYWDLRANPPNGVFLDPTAPPTITCQGNPITVSGGSGSDFNGPFDFYTFEFNLSSGNVCANVRIKKQIVGVTPCTRFDVYGTDAACGGSATVERGIVNIDPEWCLISAD